MTVRRTRALALVAATALTATVVAPLVAHADGARPYSFAVIGDVPYGDAAQQAFPSFIAGINADPDVRTVTHLGDIKSGSTTCDDARYGTIRADFDLFTDPLVYTPGDNEWTDCHRANNGAYHPLERLAKVRSLFFDRPGHTLGGDMSVASQSAQGLPENVRWERAGISFATLHVVGSNNDLAPWTGIGETAPTQAQLREERTRMDASIANMRRAFATAESHGDRIVVLQQQADMFDETVPDPSPADYSAFKPLVRALVDAASSYDGHVYLFNGDSHRFRQDQPLAAGSRWLDFYGVDGSAANLTRVTVDGSDRGETDWLKVTAQPGSDDLSVTQVPGS
ncbi:MAG: hypothetical protein ACXVWU_07665 [Nocardioides sp.]